MKKPVRKYTRQSENKKNLICKEIPIINGNNSLKIEYKKIFSFVFIAPN
ncbi:MAG: hypothetical protein JXB17_03435 [Bacteroidales bacterium]|nr:hypothetical protein [Bacteroidales bacterium]